MEIAQRPDFHIPTAATAMLPLPCSIPNRNTAHSELPRFQPAPQLKPSNTAAPLYPALPTPNSEEALYVMGGAAGRSQAADAGHDEVGGVGGGL